METVIQQIVQHFKKWKKTLHIFYDARILTLDICTVFHAKQRIPSIKKTLTFTSERFF